MCRVSSGSTIDERTGQAGGAARRMAQRRGPSRSSGPWPCAGSRHRPWCSARPSPSGGRRGSGRGRRRVGGQTEVRRGRGAGGSGGPGMGRRVAAGRRSTVAPEVDRAFDWLGDAWVEALGRSGVTGVRAHREGYRPCTRWSSLVCFGGVGTGEVVTDDGRKVVGLAQRRTPPGAWFHGACVLRWDPARLVDLLDLDPAERQAAVTGLGAAAVGASELRERSGHRPARRRRADGVGPRHGCLIRRPP